MGAFECNDISAWRLAHFVGEQAGEVAWAHRGAAGARITLRYGELLNPDGSVATVWGSPNPGPTILPNPVAVAFDGPGNAYVLDGRRGRIVVFDRASGTPVRTIAAGKLVSPTALAIDAAGTIYVADSGNARIAVSNRPSQSS